MGSKSPSLGEEGVGVAFPEDGRDEESAKVVSDPSDSVEEGVVGFDFVNSTSDLGSESESSGNFSLIVLGGCGFCSARLTVGCSLFL